VEMMISSKLARSMTLATAWKGSGLPISLV
jgi:hypothetical protein